MHRERRQRGDGQREFVVLRATCRCRGRIEWISILVYRQRCKACGDLAYSCAVVQGCSRLFLGSLLDECCRLCMQRIVYVTYVGAACVRACHP